MTNGQLILFQDFELKIETYACAIGFEIREGLLSTYAGLHIKA